MRFLDAILFMAGGGILAVFVYNQYFGEATNKEPLPVEKQEILLERIERVAKLITVEGEYKNTHTYEDYSWRNITPLRKEMIVRVNAIVYMGIDLQKVKFEPDSVNHILRVVEMPEPEILAIDSKYEYKKMSEGLFNSFDEKDLTGIQDATRILLEKEVWKGELPKVAEDAGLDVVGALVEQAGWTLVIERSRPDSSVTSEEPLPNIPDDIQMPTQDSLPD